MIINIRARILFPPVSPKIWLPENEFDFPVHVENPERD